MTNRVCALSRPFGVAVALTVALAVPATAQLELEAPHHRLTLSAADLAQLPRDTARITFRDSTFVYRGIPVHLLLQRIGVHADSLRGRRAVSTRVIFEGSDGYRVVLSLAECDPKQPDRRLILADSVDGRALPTNESPFRLLIVGDHRHSRWARQVVAIRVREESP